MAIKFKALVCFMHGSEIFNPTGETYEHENVELVLAWEKENYCKTLEKRTDVLVTEKETTVENAEDAPQDELDVLKALSYVELKERAKEAGIKGYHNMKAEKLIDALKEVK